MKYNVIVAGGGAAGIAAALAAARAGASTLLVERYGFIGGMLTAGLVAHYDPIKQIEASGIARELYDRLAERGAVKEFDMEGVEMPFRFWQGGCGIDAEEFKNVALDLLLSSKVDLLLHSWVEKTRVREGRVTGIVACNKSGEQRFDADVVVDATGDADVACQAGVPFDMATREEGGCMSSTLCFNIGGVRMEQLYGYLEENPGELGMHPRQGKYIRDARKTSIVQGFYSLIREARQAGDLTIPLPESGVGMVVLPLEGSFHVNAIRLPGMNPVDAGDLTKLEIVERRYLQEIFSFIKKYIPGCRDAFVMQSATQIGVRESRRIRGEYTLTIDDIKSGTHFPDAVVRTKWGHTDVHSGKDMGWSFEFIEGPYYIPYRCLVPLRAENLLVAGRSISATRQAMASIRIMPVCSAIGEAAGTAAALSASGGKTPRDLDPGLLRETLKSQGVLL